MLSGLRCPPRYGTDRRPDSPTFGHWVGLTSLAIHRHELMPHQKHVADVTQEVDPATGLRRYATVILIGPRQGTGKTHSVEAQLVQRTRSRPGTTSLYLAQNRLMARVRLLDELEGKRLRRSPATAGQYQPFRSNGSEAIYWHNGSKITIGANTADAGHGLTLNGDVIVDEAFAHPDLTVIQGVSPPMLTCPDPQLWIVSTLGDGTDGLLMHYQDIGLASLYDPDTRVAYFEWSRDDTQDPLDPGTWAAVIPGLGTTCTERDVADQLVNLGAPEFDRAMMCRRREETVEQRIPADIWARQARTIAEATPVAPHVLAFDVAHDRQSASIATASKTGAGHELVVIVERRPGTSWLIPELQRLQHRHRPAAVVADRRAPAGSMIDRLTAKGVPVLEPDTVEFVQSTGVLYDGLVDDGDIVHVGQPDLDRAIAQARTRPLGDAWAWNRRDSPVDISPLCAATMAAWGHRHLFAVARTGRIY